MPNSKTILSIISVNFESKEYLRGCIASVLKFLNHIENEIIIVNNDKSHLTAQDLAYFQENKEITIINNGTNIGFGAGINAGVKKARGEYLLFLNPDAEILSADLDKLLERFKKNSEIAAIGPKLTVKNNEPQEWCAGKELSFLQIIKNNLGAIESRKIWESKKEIFVDWVSGGAMFVRADVFRKIGGFDENFFMYFEDNDLCKRIRQSGYKILYAPNFEIKHLCGKSSKNKLIQKWHFFKSMAYYLIKYV